MKNLKSLAAITFLLALLGACDQGPAEQAGEDVDEAIEEGGEQLEEGGEEARDTVE